MQARTPEQQQILNRLRGVLCVLDVNNHKVKFDASDEVTPNRVEPPLILANDAPFVMHCATPEMARTMARVFTKVTGDRNFARADTENPVKSMVYISTKDLTEGALGKIEASWEAEMFRDAQEVAAQQPKERQWSGRARRNDGRTGALALQ